MTRLSNQPYLQTLFPSGNLSYQQSERSRLGTPTAGRLQRSTFPLRSAYPRNFRQNAYFNHARGQFPI